MADTPEPQSLAALADPIAPRPDVVNIVDDSTYAIYIHQCKARRLTVMRSDGYGVGTLEPLKSATLPGWCLLDTGRRSDRSQIRWDEAKGVLYYVTVAYGAVSLNVAGTSIVAVEAALDVLREMFPKREPTEDEGSIDVKFWTTGMGGPRSVTRSITAPKFEDIRDNYAAASREPLEAMMDGGFKPGLGGQLLLWWGAPGGGKTYALRALAQAWKSWCDVEYVVDPEQFFGDATYLMPVLLNMQGGVIAGDRWRLLIFEDTGELLSADARTRAGQGLSRLLNVVDGFIGQGLKTLILITTNEDLDKLHPAVSRPGRCAVKAHFEPLSAAESRRWGEKNGIRVPSGSHSLAELFALREGFTNDERTDSKPIGFRMAEPTPIRVSPLRQEAS